MWPCDVGHMQSHVISQAFMRSLGHEYHEYHFIKIDLIHESMGQVWTQDFCNVKLKFRFFIQTKLEFADIIFIWQSIV